MHFACVDSAANFDVVAGEADLHSVVDGIQTYCLLTLPQFLLRETLSGKVHDF